jgi:hypothetical protein
MRQMQGYTPGPTAAAHFETAVRHFEAEVTAVPMRMRKARATRNAAGSREAMLVRVGNATAMLLQRQNAGPRGRKRVGEAEGESGLEKEHSAPRPRGELRHGALCRSSAGIDADPDADARCAVKWRSMTAMRQRGVMPMRRGTPMGGRY